MKKLVEKTRKANLGVAFLKAVLVCQIALIVLCMPMTVQAAPSETPDSDEIEFTTEDGGELGNTKLVTGTKELIKDGTTVALILEAVIAVFLIVVKLIGMQQAEEHDKGKYKKEIKTILITAILIFCSTGLLGTIFSYYI